MPAPESTRYSRCWIVAGRNTSSTRCASTLGLLARIPAPCASSGFTSMPPMVEMGTCCEFSLSRNGVRGIVRSNRTLWRRLLMWLTRMHPQSGTSAHCAAQPKMRRPCCCAMESNNAVRPCTISIVLGLPAFRREIGSARPATPTCGPRQLVKHLLALQRRTSSLCQTRTRPGQLPPRKLAESARSRKLGTTRTKKKKTTTTMTSVETTYASPPHRRPRELEWSLE
mmetsp:Transcript_34172/g.72729  ORF Transcript_34172/g.72729 Transcript_34172/m.72729 type:complete len:226 (-) Transcript_34172:1653-2330(-)